VRKYCAGCHNDNLKSSGVSLASLQTGAPAWEKVVVKLRAGMMPPAHAPRPDAETIALLEKLGAPPPEVPVAGAPRTAAPRRSAEPSPEKDKQ
jgi:hypothetical protein